MRRICSIISLLSALLAAVPAASSSLVKEPAVAGSFYPADAAALKRDVDRYLAAVRPKEGEARPLALVVPHAGYQYSGAIAAEGYARLKGHKVSTVVLIGPSHHAPLAGAAVYPGDGMRTPLGSSLDQQSPGKVSRLRELSMSAWMTHPLPGSIRWRYSCPSSSVPWERRSKSCRS